MSPTPPEWLVALFRRHATVQDLLVSAYVHEEDPGRVVLFQKDAFLTSDDGCLMMRLTKGDGSLRFSGVDQPSLYEDHGSEDIRSLFVSLAGNFLDTYFDVRCSAVTLFLNDESELEKGLVRGALFHFNVGAVFFDPLHLDGLKIGGEAEAEAVLALHPDIETVAITMEQS
ncbi:hypothetical protein [Actinoplanes sp. NPDC051494]|uniref:hypothetical protein n=1 Tax=Actinoplanes sp. NPDC051494 TaxID=3363907 RepID=UPI0037884451